MQERSLIILLIVLIVMSCDKKQTRSLPDSQRLQNSNLLLDITTENPLTLEWFNEPMSYAIEHSRLIVVTEKGTDFFNNPEDGTITSTAPFLYKEVSGDFVARALVRPDFTSVWNAVAIMVHIDSLNWIKFAFENSDATGQSIVSVVTKNISDDANGVILTSQEEVWLKLIRKGNIYSMLWSLNGIDYKMARLTSMPSVDYLKIGIEAQCPIGDSATHEIHYFGLDHKTVKDLRKGK